MQLTAFFFFCKGKYSDSCVRRNMLTMLTKDSSCTSQVTTQNWPSRGHPKAISYSWRHKAFRLVWLGINTSVLMKWKPESVIQKLCWKLNLRYEIYYVRERNCKLYFQGLNSVTCWCNGRMDGYGGNMYFSVELFPDNSLVFTPE